MSWRKAVASPGPRLNLSLPWMPAESRPEPLSAVRLPFDEGPHHRRLEWWHFMGYVEPSHPSSSRGEAPAGRLTFVVTILKGEVGGIANLVSLVILADPNKKAHSVSTRMSLLGAAYYEPDDGRRFRFHLGPGGPSRAGPPEAWEVAGGMGTYTLNIDTSEQLALSLKQKNPAVLLGSKLDGILDYAGEDRLAYYAWPSLHVTGTRGTGKKQQRVHGRAWMEHQWGDMSLSGYRWKYLAIQLVYADRKSDEPAEQLLVIRITKGKEQRIHVVHVDTRGRARVEDHTIDRSDGRGSKDRPAPSVMVKDDDSQAAGDYPTTTILTIGAGHEWARNGERPSDAEVTLRFEAAFRDQECVTGIPEAFFPRFWEGVCKLVKGEELPTFKGRALNIEQTWAITELAGYR